MRLTTEYGEVHRKGKPVLRVPHAPWRSRWVLWASRGGLKHVVTHAAPVGVAIVATLACGGSANFGLLDTTWYSVKREHRICRRCERILKAAGERGSIMRAAREA